MTAGPGPVAASLLLPGLGQALAGARGRGLAVAGAVLLLALVLAGGGGGSLWWLLVPFWLLQAADAADLARGRPGRTALLALLGLLPLYVVGWQLSQVAPRLLVTGFPRVAPLFRGLAQPDLVDPVVETLADARILLYTPCGSQQDPANLATLDRASPSLQLQPACADLEAPLTLSGAGFPPGSQVRLLLTNGGSNAETLLGQPAVGPDGSFSLTITVPKDSVNVVTQQEKRPVQQQIQALVSRDTGQRRLSETLRLILARLGETIAIGFLATLLGTLLAIPLALLGARNLMGGSWPGRLLYGAARLVMNVVRSIESLILAIVFVVWVGQGPFAGMLALMVHTVAAVGKLFSETIEGIDEGPVEAIRAGGARLAQQVRYAVLPQVLPPFIAYAVYRWDINIRMSTVVGLVGGGGLGMLLTDWLKLGFWPQAATAILVIALVIVPMESVSNRLRDRIFAGHPLLGPRGRRVAVLALLALTVWAWREAQLQPLRLYRDLGKVQGIAASFASPLLVERRADSTVHVAELTVPCGGPAAAAPAGALRVQAPCAAAKDRVPVAAEGLPPGSRVKLAWDLGAEGELPVKLEAGGDRVGSDGAFMAQAELRPLVVQLAEAAGEPARLLLTVQAPTGWQPSGALMKVLDAILVTLLTALWATTLGALLALPVAFLAARNVMPRRPLGNLVYTASRGLLSLLRAVEPMLWALIFARWVGAGVPFPAIPALALVTFANLGKLFAEAVEDTDAGPLEALQASGASAVQQLRYGIVPQILPPFLAFGIYFWDITVRMSTVVGFVSGAGIGALLKEWMNGFQYRSAAVAILAIILLVSAMDALSARLRARLV